MCPPEFTFELPQTSCGVRVFAVGVAGGVAVGVAVSVAMCCSLSARAYVLIIQSTCGVDELGSYNLDNELVIAVIHSYELGTDELHKLTSHSSHLLL